MSGILLKLMTIIGWSVLIIFLLLLFLLLSMLLIPVRYRIECCKGEQILAKISAGWLGHLISIDYSYPDPNAAIIRILGFDIYRSDHAVNKPKKAKRIKSRNNGQKKKNTSKSVPSSTEQPVVISTDPVLHQNKEVSDIPLQTGSFTDQHPDRERKEMPEEDNSEKKLNNIISLLKKLRYYKELFTEEEVSTFIRHIFRRTFLILRSIRPRHIDGELLFGTGAPDTTGYGLALYSMFYPYYGKTFKVTADFERKILTGQLFITGRITICKLCYHVICILLDRRLYYFIRKLKREAA